MAIAFGGFSSNSGDGISSINWSHEVDAGSNLFLIVLVYAGGGVRATIDTVTFNGDACTQVPSWEQDARDTRNDAWSRVAPDTGGAYTVEITWPSEQFEVGGIAVDWSGVDQVTPLDSPAGANGNSTTATVDVASAAGDVVIDLVSGKSDPWTQGAGQTEIVEIVGDDYDGAASYESASGTPVTMSWTHGDDRWNIVGCSINPAGAPAGISIPVAMHHYRQQRDHGS